MQKAILAGGCFWGMQDLIRNFPGVTDTRVGYTGGTTKNPTYKDICNGNTGHTEAIEITFDPSVKSYKDILLFFFQMHDPTTKDRQGNDKGTQYRSAIFYTDAEQKAVAESTLREVDASGVWPGKIVTQISAADTFYPAEDYHQDYLEKNKGGYTCHFIRPNWKIAG
jgi:peptide-methionine (S)-S-oxide reductase